MSLRETKAWICSDYSYGWNSRLEWQGACNNLIQVVKKVTIKSTGHKKSRVLVCLASKADVTKLKTMIVFKGGWQEFKVSCQEFRTQAVIASSPSEWVNNELTLHWVKNVIGAVSFKLRLLAWDSYKCNMKDTNKKSWLTFHGRLLKPVAQKRIMIAWLKKGSIMKRKQAI